MGLGFSMALAGVAFVTNYVCKIEQDTYIKMVQADELSVELEHVLLPSFGSPRVASVYNQRDNVCSTIVGKHTFLVLSRKVWASPPPSYWVINNHCVIFDYRRDWNYHIHVGCSTKGCRYVHGDNHYCCSVIH